MLLINAKVYDNDFIPQDYDLRIEDGKITALAARGTLEARDSEEVLDLSGKILTPGMIDIHIHGAVGKDTMDGTEESLEAISRHLAQHGVTSFLPTTMTMGVEDIQKVFELEPELSGASMLGFHMEGPFINFNRKGAQNGEYVRLPTAAEMAEYADTSRVKIITLAPEAEGAIEFIREFSKKHVISLGHSDATYEQAIAAIEAGATSITHCFNAMPQLVSRNPGIIGAGVHSGIYGEFICDGLHLHPATVFCGYRMFGPDRMVLVSDSLRAAGLGDGEYQFGGQKVIVKDDVARVESGSIAGSISNVWNNVRNCVNFGVPLADALRMGSLTPATLIGEDEHKGSLAEGKDADFIVTNDNLEILDVYIEGKRFS